MDNASTRDDQRLECLFDATIAADVAAIGPVVDRAMQAVSMATPEASTTGAIDLALREAISNAVVHGCQQDPQKTVHITLARDHRDDQCDLVIIVRDDGDGFDPDALPNPLKGARRYATNGRGVFLIHELMDAVQFRNGGREIRMRTRLA